MEESLHYQPLRAGAGAMTMRNRTTALAVLAFLAACGAAAAERARPAPIHGADVRGLAILPSDPDVVLAGSASGHVYRSTDGGGSWRDAGEPLPLPGYVVGTLAFDPHRPGRLWAGLQGIWGSGTVASSDDQGKTWEARGKGLPAEPVYCLAFDPARSGRVYAGAISGVHRTEDGGKTWTHLSAANALVRNVSSLWVDPERPLSIVAGTFRRAYKSDDGGASWRGIFEGMALDSQVFNLRGVPGRPAELWASTCGWVYRSLSRGETWTRFKEGLADRRTPAFSVLPDGRLLAGTTSGLYLSIDGGRNWHLRTGKDVVVNAIAVHPGRADRILLGTEGGGIHLSADAGATYRASARGMTSVRVSGVCRAGDEMLVAVRDSGPVSGIHVSRDGGRSFVRESASLPPVLALRGTGGMALAATEQGLYSRSGGAWKPAKAATTRVHEIALPSSPSDTRVVVTTAAGVLEGRATAFAPAELARGMSRVVSAAYWGPSMWLSSDGGLRRALGSTREDVRVPFPGGKLLGTASALLYFGTEGAYARRAGGTAWEQLATRACRALPTEDDVLPVLLLTDDEARLVSADGPGVRVDPGVPPRDITCALLDGGDLWLGTSGHGLLAVTPATGNLASARRDW